MTQQFRTAALSRKGPDLLLWAHDVSGELAESGLIAPIQLPPRVKDRLRPVGLRAFTYKGRLYGYPLTLAAVTLIRNTKMAPEPIGTLEKLVDFSRQLKKSGGGRFGLLFEVKSAYFTFPFFSAQQADFFPVSNGVQSTGRFGLDSAGGVSALEKIVDLAHAGLVPAGTDRNIVMDKMLSGKLAFMIDGPWAIRDLKKRQIPFAVDPLPTWKGKEMRALVGAHGLMIRRSSPNQALAREFVERTILTPEGLHSFLKFDPRVPALKVSGSQWSSDFPELKAFSQSVENGVVMPNSPAMGAVWPAMKAALHQATEGHTEPASALRAAGQKIRSQIDSIYH